MDVWHVVLFVALVISLVCFYLDHRAQARTIEDWRKEYWNRNDLLRDEIVKLEKKIKDQKSEIETLKETESVNLKELDAVVKFNQELKQANEVSQLEFTRLAESSRRSVERVNGVLNPL